MDMDTTKQYNHVVSFDVLKTFRYKRAKYHIIVVFGIMAGLGLNMMIFGCFAECFIFMQQSLWNKLYMNFI